MAKAKHVEFINQLQPFTNRTKRTQVKNSLGDSVFNNRALTVNQVIRYLTRKGVRRNQRILGENLQEVFDTLKPDIRIHRSLTNSRTDAIDINEFITVYNEAVENRQFRRQLNRTLVA